MLENRFVIQTVYICTALIKESVKEIYDGKRAKEGKTDYVKHSGTFVFQATAI